MRADDGNPNPPAASRPRRQVVQFTNAVASVAPLLDDVKFRMYRDWCRGVQPAQLRINYRDPVTKQVLTVREVNIILVDVARRVGLRRAA